MSAPLKAAGGLLAGATLAAAAWFLRPDPVQTAVTPAPAAVPPAAPPARVIRETTTLGMAADDDPGLPAVGDVTLRLKNPGYWDAVKRHCPWPPDVSAWEVIDPPCLSAMNAMRLDDEWRRILSDPGGTRRAVVAALDDQQCRVPRGESRPDLREACAADAMILLAELQRNCLETAHIDWQAVHDRRAASTHRISDTQDDYHRWAEEDAEDLAYVLWKAYMCKADIEALAWIESLPEPPGDLADAGRDSFAKFESDGQGGVTLTSLVAPRLTQDVELYALAWRLGAEVPEWVPDDALPW